MGKKYDFIVDSLKMSTEWYIKCLHGIEIVSDYFLLFVFYIFIFSPINVVSFIIREKETINFIKNNSLPKTILLIKIIKKFDI